MLGYNPNSKFAADIKSKPWYEAITETGLKLGFTDPATDPKGKLVAEALTDTAKSQNLPALTTIENNKSRRLPRGDPGRAGCSRASSTRASSTPSRRRRRRSRPCR